MSNETTPGNVRLNDGLGLVPKRTDVEALMKRCQIGVGGLSALDNAHDIMAECYGTLGALMLESDRLRSQVAAIKVVGWVCQDGTPALIGSNPLKPNATLLAWRQDFHEV